jgi:molybdopterin-guanine dinucleotide biosynthesis protein A
MALMRTAILAGGASTRMGRDKALLARGGVTLLHGLVQAAAHLGPVAVVGRPVEAGIHATFLPDAVPGAGPLGGIAAALAWAAPEPVLIIAVDLPWLTSADLAWLADLPPGLDGTVVRCAGHIEPLFSRWHPSLATAVAAALADGRRSPLAVLERAAMAAYDAPADLAARLRDCDTPAAWALASGAPPDAAAP